MKIERFSTLEESLRGIACRKHYYEAATGLCPPGEIVLCPGADQRVLA
jgi:hypothetical protein